MTILDQLAEHARYRVAADKENVRLEEVKELALELKKNQSTAFAFEQALRKQELGFICECKKASPSKGLIEPDFHLRTVSLFSQNPFHAFPFCQFINKFVQISDFLHKRLFYLLNPDSAYRTCDLFSVRVQLRRIFKESAECHAQIMDCTSKPIVP